MLKEGLKDWLEKQENKEEAPSDEITGEEEEI